ncbi:MAG: hypothetical protein VKJ06_02665 [Vampirovibrionales bacterium]|nr:hypothetical protein [Vampirovibrionales bacterium]
MRGIYPGLTGTRLTAARRQCKAVFTAVCLASAVIATLGAQITHAAPATPQQLTELEQRVFSVVIDAQGQPTTRVERLETAVFGAPQQGPLEQRIDKLLATTQPAQQAQQPNPAQPETSSNAYVSTKNQAPTQYAKPLGNEGNDPDSTYSPYTDYPYPQTNSNAPADNSYSAANSATPALGSLSNQDADLAQGLSDLELKVFSQTYPNDSIDARLARLEVKFFSQPAPPGTQDAQRFERLVAVAATTPKLNEPSGPKQGVMTALPFILMILGALL